uniref:Uncharacterized protein n=1 Tax=Arundo donax TaxID=35708 RepID=A0A0A9BEB4_ARUDO
MQPWTEIEHETTLGLQNWEKVRPI